MSMELAKCKNCGGEAELKRNSSWDYFVRCKVCGTRTRNFNDNPTGAELSWNDGTCGGCYWYAVTDLGFTFCQLLHKKCSPLDFCAWREPNDEALS